MAPRARTGKPYPLGATWDGRGVNFAVHASTAAQRVTLCLFDADGSNERQVPMTQQRHDVWYGYVAGLQPGQLYGWRVHGPHDPGSGSAATRTSCCSTPTRGPSSAGRRRPAPTTLMCRARRPKTCCAASRTDEAAEVASDQAMAARGQAVLRLINAGDEATWFTLPELHGRTWTLRIDTCTHSGFPPDERPLEGGYRAAARSIVLLTQPVPA